MIKIFNRIQIPTSDKSGTTQARATTSPAQTGVALIVAPSAINGWSSTFKGSGHPSITSANFNFSHFGKY